MKMKCVGDIEGGHTFAPSAQNDNQSSHAYADGITLLRFAFLFIQGTTDLLLLLFS